MAYEDKLNTYDFFGYFVPGLVLMLSFSYIGAPDWIIKVKGNIAELGVIGTGVVFLVITYLLGHLVQIVGSVLEDKIVDKFCTKVYEEYNNLYNNSREENSQQNSGCVCNFLTCIFNLPFNILLIIIAVPFALLYELTCTIFNFCKREECDKPVNDSIKKYKERYRKTIVSKVKSYVERYVAHKAMYRGLFITFYIVSFITFIELDCLTGIGVIILLILSVNRYFHFRKKLIKEVYETTQYIYRQLYIAF